MDFLGSMGQISALRLCLLKFKTCWVIFFIFFNAIISINPVYIFICWQMCLFLFPCASCGANLKPVIKGKWLLLFFYLSAPSHLWLSSNHGMSNTVVCLAFTLPCSMANHWWCMMSALDFLCCVLHLTCWHALWNVCAYLYCINHQVYTRNVFTLVFTIIFSMTASLQYRALDQACIVCIFCIGVCVV